MASELPPDELGLAGEDLFRGLCGLTRLVANKSDRDRTGWDFIVEFPMQEDIVLDKRPAAACHVQLKSTAGENGARISAKLSAVDRLAKDPRPALIIVFRLRSDGLPIAGYLIHLIDGQLARVLRRLRIAAAAGDRATNHLKISFEYQRIGTRFKLTPEGLREALANAVGSDPAGYTREKLRQLDELGYEDGHLWGEVLFRVEDSQHLTNIMLGLAPVRPVEMKVWDNRFGIRIPTTDSLLESLTEFHLDLPRVGPCSVVIRGDPFEQAVRFQTEVFVPPQMEDQPWLLLKHPDFIIKFREGGLNFETTGQLDEGGKTLDAWSSLFRGLLYMSRGTATLAIEDCGDGKARTTVAVNTPLDGPYIEQLPSLSRLIDGWQQILQIAGVESNETFELDDIWNAKQVGFAVDALLNPTPIGSFEFDNLENARAEQAVEAIFFNTCTLGGAAVSYSIKVTLVQATEGARIYRSVNFKRLDVRPAVADLDAYGEEEASKHGLTVLINPSNVTMTAKHSEECPPAATL